MAPKGKRKADAMSDASDPLAWARDGQADNRLRLQLENGALVNLNEEQLHVVASALQGAKYDTAYLKMKKKEGSPLCDSVRTAAACNRCTDS